MNPTVKRLEKFIETSIFDKTRMSSADFIIRYEYWLNQFPGSQEILNAVKQNKIYPHQALVKILNIIHSNELKAENVKAKFSLKNSILLVVVNNGIDTPYDNFTDIRLAKDEALKLKKEGKSVKIIDYRFGTPFEVK